jgi:Family of unknown function (DUF5996)
VRYDGHADFGSWPDLPYSAWRDTRTTLHLWTQIVGKIRLSQTPWLNHSWHVALYVTARGLTTSPIPYGERVFQIDLDFIDRALRIQTSDGRRWQMPLHAQSVADFYAAIMAALSDVGIEVHINEFPLWPACAPASGRGDSRQLVTCRDLQRLVP